jgi:hypothetical protein
MGLTVTKYSDPTTAAAPFIIGDRKMVLGTITFDDSYPTGGEAVVPADFGFEAQVDAVLVGMDAAGARLVTYDRANQKIVLFTAVGAEAADESNQSTIVVPFLAIGK